MELSTIFLSFRRCKGNDFSDNFQGFQEIVCEHSRFFDARQRMYYFVDLRQIPAVLFGVLPYLMYLCAQNSIYIISMNMMENKNNRYLAVTYKLYVDGDNGKEMVEEATQEKPFAWITGFGYALDAFEQQLEALEKGKSFDFTLTKEQAYGEYKEEAVLDLEREMFCINGHFDHDNIYPEAIIPLQNEEGLRFYGRVVEIGEEKVKVDLNHPLAGETLHFQGEVLENREATEAEISHLKKHMSGGCHCGDCEGDCGDCGHDHHDSGCGCGHCH